MSHIISKHINRHLPGNVARATAATALCVAGLAVSAPAAELVQTRYTPRVPVDDTQTELTLETGDFFQAFADGQPMAHFHIDLPVQSERGYAQVQVGQNNTWMEMMTYENELNIEYTNNGQLTSSDLTRRLVTLNVQLDPATAPVAVANFLTYVQDGRYEETIIHRNPSSYGDPGNLLSQFSRYEIIQGGALRFHEDDKAYALETYDPIELEDGGSNTTGTIALARTSDPDSATSQWYFNLDDNSALFDRSGDSPGYSVFGSLATEDDLALAREIAQAHWFNVGSYNTLPLYLGRIDGPESFVRFDNITYTPGTWNGVQFEVEEVARFRTSAHILINEIFPPEVVIPAADFEYGSYVKFRIRATLGEQTGETTVYVHKPHPDAARVLNGRHYDDNWILSAWYGWVWAADFPWIRHVEHGTQFVHPSASGDFLWIYDPRMGWFATSPKLYPWVLSANHGYLYYLAGGSSEGRWFWSPNSSGSVSGWFLDTSLGD